MKNDRRTGSHRPGSMTSGNPNTAADRDAVTIRITAVDDIVSARQHGRELALELGFSLSESTLIATAISELVRNIVLYASVGDVRVESVNAADRIGIMITARDEGPGIRDLQRALTGGYSTSGGLGLGMSGVRRMMDEFQVDSEVDKGTTVVAKKWLR